MTATLTPPADLLRKISEPGINVNLPGLVDRTRTLQQEELVLIEQLNEITDFPSLKKANPSEFKKDSSFNPRSKKHINAYLRAQGQTELNSVREDMLEQHLPHDLSNTLMAARRKRKFTTDLATLRKHINPTTNRVHVKWTEAKTGRWYSGQPPLQTMAKICREVLVPSPSNALYVLDWNNRSSVSSPTCPAIRTS